MINLPPFEPFPSIGRLKRDCVITEKLDGTNGQVVILEDGTVLAGSRKRWITPEDDNFGFARWVKEHEDELREGLGIGRHFGEWWGLGIQRRYGLQEKRFSLFNVERWGDHNPPPACCSVVPILYRGPFTDDATIGAMDLLRKQGSVAATGFPDPEGIVIYHYATKTLFKRTFEYDEAGKGGMTVQ